MLTRGAIALALFYALQGGRAFAQIDPDDTGQGTRLGLAQQNNSGQVGTVELLANGNEGTLVVVRVFSAPPHRDERARIARARSCREPGASPVLELAPVARGYSRTVVSRGRGGLISGRYIVEVFRAGRRGLERVSCGELRR
jgi:hypothetical protein